MPRLILAATRPLDLSGVPRWHDELRAAGVDELQVNVHDDAVAAGLTIQHLEHPIETVVSTSGGFGADILRILSDPLGELVGWEVDVRQPLPPPPVPNGVRADALANLAFLRRPREMSYDAWLQHWHQHLFDPGTECLAIDGAIDHPGCQQAFVSQGAHHCRRLPMPARSLPETARANR